MSIAKKMRLKDGLLLLLKAPGECTALFEGTEVKTSLSGKAGFAQAVLFARDVKTLDETAPKVIARLEDDAVFWIAYPKKTGAIKSDISRDNGWDAVSGLGYEPVTQVAIDDNWSALRFRKSAAIGPKLRDVPIGQRQSEGIDFVNRTVTLPKDIAIELKKHKELHALFSKMSFTHKKEYITYITEAKKPETRARRIGKMIEMLETYKAEKEKKK